MMKRIGLQVVLLMVVLNANAQQSYDTLLTDISRYISGLPCESVRFKTLQQKKYYADHKTFTEKSWKYLADSTLTPVRNWAIQKNIIEPGDTGTCFYPFSGPDFLFADAFFPYVKNYIMLGLERSGTVPDFNKLNDEQLMNYLGAIRSSMRYLNKSGYFVTEHMSSDFTKSVLNGTLHMIFYFAARTGHNIVNVEHGYLDASGAFKSTGNKSSENYFKGIHITICDSIGKDVKHIYYFSCDVADYRIKNKPNLVNFVKKFNGVNTYIKSASYIPAHKNFSMVRNLILEKSEKIVQDDTGIQFKILNDPKKYDYQMWGTYTSTIKDLSWGFQPDLKEAVSKSPENKKLPFRISYNGNYGEGLMMYARKKKI